MAQASAPPTPRTLQCMEVWGGNQAVDNGVVLPGLDAWVYGRPFAQREEDTEGGDVHYLSSCASGRIIRVLVADVSGHGMAVAKIASMLRGLMRRHINHIDQSSLVASLNSEFAAVASDGGFATAVVGTYWAPTGELRLTNAGHPRPLWFDASQKRWRTLRPAENTASDVPRNVPLGIIEAARYDQLEVPLDRGDLVLLYTDSLIEARGEDGKTIGEQGLLRAVADLPTDEPHKLLGRLLARLGGRFDDDVTAVLLRRNGVAPVMTFAERLAVLGRLARGLWPDAHGVRAFLPEFSPRNVGGFFLDRLNRRKSGRRQPPAEDSGV